MAFVKTKLKRTFTTNPARVPGPSVAVLAVLWGRAHSRWEDGPHALNGECHVGGFHVVL